MRFGVSPMPLNWPTSQLRDLADVRVSNVDKKSYAAERPIRLCNYMDVYANDYLTSALLDFMPATASPSEIERFALHAGDVVITKDSETPDDIGVPAVIVEDIDGLVCGYHLALIRPKASVHPTFLAKQLASAPTIRYFAANATGSTRFGLAIGTIEKLDIPTPPIAEQSKIAEVLSTADRAIEQTEALIAKQQRIKTGLMQDLLTRGIDEHGNLRSEQFHEFKDSLLGRIPVEWDPMPFGSCGQWFSGGTPSKAIRRFWGGGVPWVCPKDMKQFELHQSIDTITGDAVAAGARLMPTGTVFIVIRGMILAHTFPVGVSTTEVAFNQDVKAIVPKQGLMGRYLAYWLSSHSHQFLKLATTATHGTKRFDMDELQAALVGVPLPNEQKHIVRIFDEQQSVIERLQGLTAKLQAEKRGLMKDLLTGDRRVTALLGSPEQVVGA